MGNNRCGIPIKKITHLKYLKLAICFSFPTTALRTPRSDRKHERIPSKTGKAWPAVVLALPHSQFGLDCLWLRRSYWKAKMEPTGRGKKSRLLRADPRHKKCQYFLRLERVPWQWATSQWKKQQQKKTTLWKTSGISTYRCFWNMSDIFDNETAQENLC